MKNVKDVELPSSLSIQPSYGAWAEYHIAEAVRLQGEDPGTEVQSEEEHLALSRYESDVKRHCSSAILFSALAIEAFLNTCGVVRLGDWYYSTNCEALRPLEKASAIVAALTQKLLEPDDIIVQAIRTVFAARNKIAHPKTKKLSLSQVLEDAVKGNAPPRFGFVVDAKASVNAMQRFFDEFLVIDPGSSLWLEHYRAESFRK